MRVLRRQAASEAEGAAVANRVLQGDRAALSELRDARRTVEVMKGRCLI
jgi:hypothetical protein